MIAPVSLALTYVGHATVLIELDGERLVTDPLLRQRVWHVRRHAAPARVDPVDTILVSHAHYDHLDIPSLIRVGRTSRVVVPRGLGRILRLRRFANVVEVDVGDEVASGSVVVRATAARHSGKRIGAAGPALGYVVRGAESVYFAGDTGLFPELEAIGDDGIDVALLPVWGWGTGLDEEHLDPERAAEAARLLRPRVAVPIHWGTYGSKGADVSRAPAERFARACGDDVDVRILEPGERLAC
jgi:L-ascorbate metabolism protein UlaG (beta-lactamase superfamily)